MITKPREIRQFLKGRQKNPQENGFPPPTSDTESGSSATAKRREGRKRQNALKQLIVVKYHGFMAGMHTHVRISVLLLTRNCPDTPSYSTGIRAESVTTWRKLRTATQFLGIGLSSVCTDLWLKHGGRRISSHLTRLISLSLSLSLSPETQTWKSGDYR